MNNNIFNKCVNLGYKIGLNKQKLIKKLLAK